MEGNPLKNVFAVLGSIAGAVAGVAFFMVSASSNNRIEAFEDAQNDVIKNAKMDITTKTDTVIVNGQTHVKSIADTTYVVSAADMKRLKALQPN